MIIEILGDNSELIFTYKSITYIFLYDPSAITTFMELPESLFKEYFMTELI